MRKGRREDEIHACAGLRAGSNLVSRFRPDAIAGFAGLDSPARATRGYRRLPAEPAVCGEGQPDSLLLNARIRGPYVLVGQSWGGAIARVYSSQHPELVAGMVLVDSTHEDAQLGINGRLVRPRLAPAGEAVPLRTDMELLFSTREGRPHPLGEMPIVVLSRGKADYPQVAGTTPEEMFADQKRLQADLVQLSQNSKQVIATTSGHSIHRDDPPLVIAAIREVVEAIRRHRRLDGAAENLNRSARRGSGRR